MKTSELVNVSKLMNDLFLEMIGADQAQQSLSVIQRAEVTPDFRIVVFGQQERRLDPSTDLNGASRRALTIAFILALTKVSDVEAPNVIDTPLGMMAGFVKRAVLRTAATNSSQLILFLTQDEINGCEDILEHKAGKYLTMTNPTHYPQILVNKPDVTDTRVLTCKCKWDQHCRLCERRKDAKSKQKMTTHA